MLSPLCTIEAGLPSSGTNARSIWDAGVLALTWCSQVCWPEPFDGAVLVRVRAVLCSPRIMIAELLPMQLFEHICKTERIPSASARHLVQSWSDLTLEKDRWRSCRCSFCLPLLFRPFMRPCCSPGQAWQRRRRSQCLVAEEAEISSREATRYTLDWQVQGLTPSH